MFKLALLTFCSRIEIRSYDRLASHRRRTADAGTAKARCNALRSKTGRVGVSCFTVQRIRVGLSGRVVAGALLQLKDPMSHWVPS